MVFVRIFSIHKETYITETHSAGSLGRKKKKINKGKRQHPEAIIFGSVEKWRNADKMKSSRKRKPLVAPDKAVFTYLKLCVGITQSCKETIKVLESKRTLTIKKFRKKSKTSISPKHFTEDLSHFCFRKLGVFYKHAVKKIEKLDNWMVA